MSETSEELLSRHRKEKKDLQNQIQGLKKSCAKGDKKRKKEVQDEISRLELELSQKHAKELSEIEETDTQEATEENNVQNEEEAEEEEIPAKETRLSKAQKRRNKKAAEDKEREERINLGKQESKNGPRNKEIKQIEKILKESGLKLYNIPADGNCLYCAVVHQLTETGRPTYSVQELRNLTASYMRQNKDDFLPFMTHVDEDKIFTEDQYEEYCKTLEKKPVWGGQIEIRALSSLLKCPIKVIQASTGETVQGEQYEGNPLVLTYHRHLYRLGEHYNSTTAITNEKFEDEDS